MKMIQPQINAATASTTAVKVGLKKNITGTKNRRIPASSTVPKSWPTRKFRTRPIWLILCIVKPAGVRSK